jgi:hypothetical protein
MDAQAAFRYHGKTGPPKPKKEMKVELDVLVSLASRGIAPPGAVYTVENVSGKLISAKDDLLTYRIKFAPGVVSVDDQGIVRVSPNATIVDRRREGRAECGFFFQLPHPLPAETVTRGYYCMPSGVSLVLSPDGQFISELYFALEDTNIEPAGAPKWRVRADTSGILETYTKGRWTALKDIHPDPSVDPGVPIEFRPQGDPRWYYYRSSCEHYDLFKGKLSGSRMFRFIGGASFNRETAFFDDVGFKGNNLTRNGRMNECKMVLACLLAHAKDGMRMFEAGSYPHPRIPDICAAPDAIVVVPAVTFEGLSAWQKDLILNAPNPIDVTKVDWTRGFFESKVMLRLDTKDKLGPVMKPDYLCQAYMEMICTGTYWGFVQRGCSETKECRLYHVFLKPALANRLEKCIMRMREEMIGGTPYAAAIEHVTNKEVCR